MTTQYEREQAARVAKARLLLALAGAAVAAHAVIPPSQRETIDALGTALEDMRWEIQNAEHAVAAHKDRQISLEIAASEARNRESQVRGIRSVGEYCEARVPESGRWIGFHRCQMKAHWIVPFQDRDEEVPVDTGVCGTHKTQWTKLGRLQYGRYDR